MERLNENQEKTPADAHKLASRLVDNARDNAAERYGRQVLKPDYFRSYENRAGLVSAFKQTTIETTKGKRTYYELVVSAENGGTFDPSEYVDVDDEENGKFVILKFTMLKNRIYVEGRHDFESEPKLLEANDNTAQRIMDSGWLNHAIHGNYLTPDEVIPESLDRWNLKI